MIKLTDLVIPSLLPSSLKNDPFVIALAEVFEIELKEAYREAERLANLSDIDNLPEKLLDYLAYQKHVDFYDNSLSIEQKRDLIKFSQQWHRKKGTKWAIETVVSIFFKNSHVVEWFEYNQSPYHFQVEILPLNVTRKRIEQLYKMINATKNARSVFDVLVALFQEDSLELSENNYFYPVFYKETGFFSGSKNFFQYREERLDVNVEPYHFNVKYPIVEKKVSTLSGELTELVDGTYDYQKSFYYAGELEPLKKETNTLSTRSKMSHDCYSFSNPYPVCGEFYSESE